MVYRFGEFELDIESHRFTRSGDRVDLPPLSFALLASLVEAAPESVSRERLMEQLWPDRVVGEETLTERVKLLRRELGDTGAELVITERGWGYRLAVTPVRLDKDASAQPGSRRRVARVVALLLLAIGVIVTVLWMQRPTESDQQRLAILPFVDRTTEQTSAHVALGLTEELSYELARIDTSRLLVLGRHTAERVSEDPAAAVELAIDYVISGHIRNRNTTRVVTIDLVRAVDSTEVWSFEMIVPPGESLRWQRDAINEAAIALRLEADLPGESGQVRVPIEARDAYLRGRYAWRHWTTRGFTEALAAFERAIALEPEYADAHAGLADALGTLAYSGVLPHTEALDRARHHAATALDISPDSARARVSLAMAEFFAEWRTDGADQVLSELLLADANNTDLLLALANVRWAQGCDKKAISLMEHAVRIDPYSPILRSALALSFFFDRDYEQARRQADLVLAAEPTYGHAIFLAGMSAALLGEYEVALEYLHNAKGDELTSARGYALASAGRREEAESLLEREWGDGAYTARARLLAALGDDARARQEIERAVDAAAPALVMMHRYPVVGSIERSELVEARLARLDGDCL